MRLLVLPTYSNTSNLSGCSAYNLSTKFIKHILESREDVFIYRMLPSTEDGVWNNNTVPFVHPRLKEFTTTMFKSQYVECGMITKDIYDLFNQVVGTYHIDAVLCERPAAAMILQKVIQHYFDDRAVRLPVFLREPFIKTSEMHGISDIEEIGQTAGYLNSNVIIYSEHDKAQLLSVARRYLNPSAIKKLMEHIKLIPSGTDCDEMDKVVSVAKKREKFTVAVCERLTAQQQAFELTSILDTCYSAGHDIGFMISTQSGSGMINHRVGDWAEIHYKNSRENYLKLMPECHAFLSTSVHHSYSQALFEQLYCGLVGILPNLPWFTTFMPNYPFMYPSGNFTAAGAMLRWVKDNYEEAKKRVAYVPGFIRDNFHVQKQSLKMFEWMDREVTIAKQNTKIPGGFMEVYNDINLPDGFTLNDALDFFKQNSKYKIELREDKGGFSTSKSIVVVLLERLGYYDSCTSEHPTFYRRKP